MKPTIRKATIDDVASLGNVYYQCWQTTYKGLINDEYLASQSIDKCIRIFDEDYRNCICAEINKQIIGLLTYNISPDKVIEQNEAHIGALYILKEYQKQGIGRMLINSLLEYMQKMAIDIVGLWVVAANKNALQFYEHYGFHFTGQSKEVKLVTNVTGLFYDMKLNDYNDSKEVRA